MRRALMIVALMACLVAPAMAAPGESWILPISSRDGGGWTELPGAGYGGASAWQGDTIDGVRRVYWAMGNQAGMPSTKELFTAEFFVPTTGTTGWQPIETANVGENEGAMNAVIPWAGQWGTNHQWIGAENGTPGTWKATGPGPQAPESAAYGAGGNGIYMWMDGNARLYAKWNYGWPISHAWSAIRVTQITPEPASALLLMLAAPVLLRRRGR